MNLKEIEDIIGEKIIVENGKIDLKYLEMIYRFYKNEYDYNYNLDLTLQDIVDNLGKEKALELEQKLNNPARNIYSKCLMMYKNL